jgi:nitrous oxidase accessory protein
MGNDGIGDTIFEPNDGIDKLVWQYPEMKMIMDSPAILILRWVQRQFPVLKPPGVKDSFPLMSAPSLSKNEQTLTPTLTKSNSAQSTNTTSASLKE